jgi:hypothetical protein
MHQTVLPSIQPNIYDMSLCWTLFHAASKPYQVKIICGSRRGGGYIGGWIVVNLLTDCVIATDCT